MLVYKAFYVFLEFIICTYINLLDNNTGDDMKAALLYGPYDIRVENVSMPSVSKNEVLVRVKVAGICGTDLHSYRGKHPFLKPPRILGHEFSGEIFEVGDEVKEFKENEKVIVEPIIPCGKCDMCNLGMYNVCRNLKVLGVHVDGAFAEYVKVPEERLYRLPESLSYEEGALIEPLAVAVHVVRRGGVKIGDEVAILGAGPIGLLIAQVSKCAGASRVFITDILDYRLELAEKLGVDITINAMKEDPVKRILEETNGKGVDIAIEAAGAPSTPAQALKMTKPLGRVVIVGFFETSEIKVNLLDIVAKELHIVGSRLYRNDFDTAINLLSKGKINVTSLISHKLPLEEIKRAFEMLDKKVNNPVKVLLMIG